MIITDSTVDTVLSGNHCSCKELDDLRSHISRLESNIDGLRMEVRVQYAHHQRQHNDLCARTDEDLEKLQKQIDYLKLPWWKKLLSPK